MPYKSYYVDPEIIVDHEETELLVVRTYKDNDIEQPLHYWYEVLHNQSDYDEAIGFDVRDLPNYNLVNNHNHKFIIKEAVENCVLTKNGIIQE